MSCLISLCPPSGIFRVESRSFEVENIIKASSFRPDLPKCDCRLESPDHSGPHPSDRPYHSIQRCIILLSCTCFSRTRRKLAENQPKEVQYPSHVTCSVETKSKSASPDSLSLQFQRAMNRDTESPDLRVRCFAPLA